MSTCVPDAGVNARDTAGDTGEVLTQTMISVVCNYLFPCLPLWSPSVPGLLHRPSLVLATSSLGTAGPEGDPLTSPQGDLWGP